MYQGKKDEARGKWGEPVDILKHGNEHGGDVSEGRL